MRRGVERLAEFSQLVERGGLDMTGVQVASDQAVSLGKVLALGRGLDIKHRSPCSGVGGLDPKLVIRVAGALPSRRLRSRSSSHRWRRMRPSVRPDTSGPRQARLAGLGQCSGRPGRGHCAAERMPESTAGRRGRSGRSPDADELRVGGCRCRLSAGQLREPGRLSAVGRVPAGPAPHPQGGQGEGGEEHDDADE
jgi:hypothetical protein